MLSAIYVECHKLADYAECLYAECRYPECRGATTATAIFQHIQVLANCSSSVVEPLTPEP